MDKLKIGFALCGSFCTFKQAIEQMENLKERGVDITPIMSFNAYSTDTRFGRASEHVEKIEAICGKKIISTLAGAEPIGPKKLFDVLVIEPCTGNTLAKLAAGITDSPVTFAAKAHLRNERPVVIAISTNDALAAAASNIGRLLNYKNVYFVPIRQDDEVKKPRSAVADFTKTFETVKKAAVGEQIQPILIK